MEQHNSDGSILDLDLDDIDESDTESNNAATLNQHPEGGRGVGGGVIIAGGGGGGGGQGRGVGGQGGRGGVIEITERPTTRLVTEKPPKTAASSIQFFSSVTLSGRGKEMLNEAELGVNRIVAVSPTILQNQYWMLPGAVFDD